MESSAIDLIHQSTADLADSFKEQARWRRERAKNFPGDDRNEAASEIFKELARQCESGAYDADAFERYASLAHGDDEDSSLTAHEEERDLRLEIGFRFFPDDLNEFLAELISRIERRAA